MVISERGWRVHRSASGIRILVIEDVVRTLGVPRVCAEVELASCTVAVVRVLERDLWMCDPLDRVLWATSLAVATHVPITKGNDRQGRRSS